ncbi:S8 family serine peptidase [Porphyromonas pogonae]|uniref:S8 family serine peptidase n=1 Tax=Porphyromonas pogonae TaxID=867595 RepID=UPI002E7670A7|nr:S8 family serine peptidase [Porphyromonas pogonae]
MKKYILYSLCISAMLSSCTSEREFDNVTYSSSPNKVQPAINLVGNGIPGEMNIKVSEEVARSLEVSQTGKTSLRSFTPGIMRAMSSIGTTEAARVFPDAGKYEARSREMGLHLWYNVKFDVKQNLDKALDLMSQNSDISIVEKSYATSIPDLSVDDTPVVFPKSEKELPFNDPGLIYQWHYDNQGLYPRSVKGADINLYEAWRYTTGKPQVIVSVVDGGIDYSHEDLKDNMYINEAEKNGLPNVDDDKNGYVDDIYGYNFYNNKGQIVPDSMGHGTHVAGIVGAKNNNGIGVCGVAGGDGSPNSGVRLMSCQTFVNILCYTQDNAKAIKYGADNGALISQNSWAYPHSGPQALPALIKDAIDYFIKYAGCDENGNQKSNSLMKGGVVIFAVGNENREYNVHPASYPEVISVSSMAPNFTRAWYSNLGKWVSIMAPGGDSTFTTQGKVYSTLPPSIGKKVKYGYMQGTSMACPHVSGLAALIISKYGKAGFTCDDLKKRLLASIKPIDINELNPQYTNKLGCGYLDAGKAFVSNLKYALDAPDFLNPLVSANKMNLIWNTVVDKDDTTADKYILYMSKEPLSVDNFETQYLKKHSIVAAGYSSGQRMEYTVSDLEPNTRYYFAIQAVDRWGLRSSPKVFSITTHI